MSFTKDQGIELAMVMAAVALYAGYHLWLFWGREVINRRLQRNTKRVDVFSQSRDARLLWTYVVRQSPTDSAVPAVQTLRNSIMAASFMATTCGLMATSGVLQILTDDRRLGEVRKLGDLDPIVDLAGSHGLVRAPWKLAFALFLLLVSLLFFVQTIRLQSFLAYYIRLGARDIPEEYQPDVHLVLALARRSGHCWSAGIRSFYFVIPSLMWIMGPLVALVVTIILVVILYISDEVSVRDFSSIINRGRPQMNEQGDAARVSSKGDEPARHDGKVQHEVGP